MIQSIFVYILQGLVFLLLPTIYVFLTACLLPRLLLKPHFGPEGIKDRGLQRYLFENGRAITYQPDPAILDYMPQYILSDNNGERFLKCKLDERVQSIAYRVLTFDANDRPLEVLKVEDPVQNSGTTRSVPLPLRTAYVSIDILQVNGIKIPSLHPINLRKRNVVIYVAITSLMTALMLLPLRQALLLAADLLFAYTDTVGSKGTIGIFAALLLGAVYAGIVFLTHFVKGSKLNK